MFTVLLHSALSHSTTPLGESPQTDSFSSYVRGAALFCAGVVCMKGASYLYQRYNMYQRQSRLNDVRRLSMDRSGERVSGDHDNLFSKMIQANGILTGRLNHTCDSEIMESTTKKITLLTPDVTATLTEDQKQCVKNMEESYAMIFEHIGNIEYQYLVYSSPQVKQLRRLSSIFSGGDSLRKRVSRTWSNIFAQKPADSGQSDE